eukprot:CAMPEP_0168323486 /NCGR_PEP_ID=MMETSP0213-20121227/3512_1 /TAXON_ID=151035 /ORGANISM="Euplotes harpa, Strain FSP1.4" /LENGTH=205 /DNA_ID=CAMNT_0008325571 /DNA_START=15 /DNA_END=632 /DNA_ORIENTATION=-
MAANPELYESWKKSAKYSDDFKMKQTFKEEEDKFEESKQKFFTIHGVDEELWKEKKKKEMEENSVFNLKKQFLLESNQSIAPVHHHDDNIDFQTTNGFYHSLTKNSVKTQHDNPVESPVLNDLEPEVFEITAKKASSIWKTNTYKDPEFRGELNTTTKKIDQQFDDEMAAKLHKNTFNKRITVISEYSNAMHNGRVFKNPRFTSC